MASTYTKNTIIYTPNSTSTTLKNNRAEKDLIIRYILNSIPLYTSTFYFQTHTTPIKTMSFTC